VGKITHNLIKISKDENIFKKKVLNLQKLFKHIGTVDSEHYKELKERASKTEGKERQILEAEIRNEDEKLRIEKMIFEFERKLDQSLNMFNQHTIRALNVIKGSPYPYDALYPLKQAGTILNGILEMIKETKALEEKLIEMTKVEKKLLKKEKKAE